MDRAFNCFKKKNRRDPDRLGRRLWGFLVLLWIGWQAAPAAGQQGIPRVVTMKSGAQFEGLIASIGELAEGRSVADPYGAKQVVLIDDGLRRVFVGMNRIFPDLGDSNRVEIELPVYQREANSVLGGAGCSMISTGPFNELGHRELVFRDPKGKVQTLIQGITLISPRFCEVRTLVGTQRQWPMRIGTGTVPTEVLRSLLRLQIKNENDISEHQKIADLFLQAGNFQQASEELRLIQQRFPDDTKLSEEINRHRQLIHQRYARQILDEAELRMKSGQNQLAKGFLTGAINTEGVAGEILAEFRGLQAKIDRQRTQHDITIDQLQKMFDASDDWSPKHVAAFNRLIEEVRRDLSPANSPRFDSWRLALQDRAVTSKQKLALAIGGWILGSNAADNNLGVAESLFIVRDLVVEYLQTDTDQNARRAEILEELKNFEAGTPPYLASLVAQLTPVDPPELTAPVGEQPIAFEVTIPGTPANPEPTSFDCLAHVPPEYDPYRRYPLLIALPGRATIQQELNLWCGAWNPALGVRQGHAMRQGYIVLAVQWKEQPGQRTNHYSAAEHAVVLKAMRAAMRKFSVDSERIFLSGHGIGGNVAYDVGLSHPEHWAGIIGISGVMDRYINKYATNRHVPLPVYSVVGEKNISAIALNKFAWNTWLPSKKYVDCTVVQYLGRANDLLVEEIPKVFDWARVQRRRWPDAGGFEFECKTLRPWDNYFWFLELHEIPEANVVWPSQWRNRRLKPLPISGKLNAGQPNQFTLGPRNSKVDATLWLSPDYIDFQKPIKITSSMGRDFDDFAVPSNRVLLEDVRTRCDRQHPYWAKVNMRDSRWSTSEPDLPAAR